MRFADSAGAARAAHSGLGTLWFVACAIGVAGCSSSNQPSIGASCTPTGTSNTVTSSTAAPTGTNVMPITVNGNLCGTGAYPNEPCAAVQVCTHGGACFTISNLLIDTGSYGLRIFKSVLDANGIAPDYTTPSPGGGNALAECVDYGDGSSEWGKVGLVDVVLGDFVHGNPETKISNLPIQVIDSTYPGAPAWCTSAQSTPDTSPSAVGFNGILGVGLFTRDCDTSCTNGGSDPVKNRNFQYYSCNGTTCSDTLGNTPANYVVPNPVSMLSADNNGVIMQLPNVPDAGAASVSGYLILGIGTRANNAASGVQMYPADPRSATFSANFDPFSSTALSSFIDSGSSLIFFPWPPPSDTAESSIIPDCGDTHSGMSGFYCPSPAQNLGATNKGYNSGTSSCVGFQAGNAYDLLSNSHNNVFANLTGTSGSDTSSDFDWGLPFFLGRKVYVGIDGKAATGLGTGPFWAY